MTTDDSKQEEKGSKFELLCGFGLAVFAAVLALNDLAAGKYGDDELLASNERTASYMWYQSKGIKETTLEGEKGFLQALLDTSSVTEDKRASVDARMTTLTRDLERYRKEKREILLGSAQVGEEGWTQEVDGKKGQITGAKEWETRQKLLGEVGDIFDRGTLFLQLCLVGGAISLIIKNPRSQNWYFGGMVILGIIGAVFTAYGYSVALTIP
jgi:hypothetical protein